MHRSSNPIRKNSEKYSEKILGIHGCNYLNYFNELYSFPVILFTVAFLKQIVLFLVFHLHCTISIALAYANLWISHCTSKLKNKLRNPEIKLNDEWLNYIHVIYNSMGFLPGLTRLAFSPLLSNGNTLVALG